MILVDLLPAIGAIISLVAVFFLSELQTRRRTHTPEWRDQRTVQWLYSDLAPVPDEVDWEEFERVVAARLRANFCIDIGDAMARAHPRNVDHGIRIDTCRCGQCFACKSRELQAHVRAIRNPGW